MLKKYSFYVSLGTILLASFFSLSCSNDDVDVTQLQPTELEITVLNRNGQPVPNAEVRLFRSQRAFELLSQDVARGTTNGSGKILFSDLQPVNYYFYASYKDQGAGLIRSNYGNWDDQIFGSFSNISLYDFLTENGLTKVSVSTLFSKPINPSLVSFDELIVIYTGEEKDFPGSATDSLEIAFGLYAGGYDINISAQQQNNLLVSGTDLRYMFFQESPNNVLGELYYYGFDDPVILDYKAMVTGEFEGFSIPLDLVPLTYDEGTDSYDFLFETGTLYPFLDDELYDALYNAGNSGDYPNRVIIDPAANLGKSNYIFDLKLSWN